MVLDRLVAEKINNTTETIEHKKILNKNNNADNTNIMINTTLIIIS